MPKNPCAFWYIAVAIHKSGEEFFDVQYDKGCQRMPVPDINIKISNEATFRLDTNDGAFCSMDEYSYFSIFLI